MVPIEIGFPQVLLERNSVLLKHIIFEYTDDFSIEVLVEAMPLTKFRDERIVHLASPRFEVVLRFVAPAQRD